jgi:hypothetical protein
MNCPEAREAFSDLYDGTLSGHPLAELSRHLDGCPACRAEWVAFRRAMHALKDLGDEEPSPDFAARVAERIEAPRWWQRVVTTLVLPLRVKLPIHAAALVLLGLAGLWVSQRSPEIERAAVGHAPAVTQRAAPGRSARAPARDGEKTEPRRAAPPSPTTRLRRNPRRRLPALGRSRTLAIPEDKDVAHALGAKEAARPMAARPRRVPRRKARLLSPDGCSASSSDAPRNRTTSEPNPECPPRRGPPVPVRG